MRDEELGQVVEDLAGTRHQLGTAGLEIIIREHHHHGARGRLDVESVDLRPRVELFARTIAVRQRGALLGHDLIGPHLGQSCGAYREIRLVLRHFRGVALRGIFGIRQLFLGHRQIERVVPRDIRVGCGVADGRACVRQGIVRRCRDARSQRQRNRECRADDQGF